MKSVMLLTNVKGPLGISFTHIGNRVTEIARVPLPLHSGR